VTASTALILLKYKIRRVQVSEGGNYERKMNFCNWFLWVVYDSVLETELTFFTDNIWFHLSANINAQNNRFWSNINPREAFEVPLHNQMIGEQCAIAAT
jgi:hypothetical protein